MNWYAEKNREEWMFGSQVVNQSVEKGSMPWGRYAAQLLVQADQAITRQRGLRLEYLEPGTEPDQLDGQLVWLASCRTLLRLAPEPR